MKKKLGVLLLSAVLTLTNIYPVMAEKSVGKDKISTWAVSEVYSAQQAGVFDSSKLDSNTDFKKTVTEEQLKDLENNTRAKFNSFKGLKNPHYSKVKYSYAPTRDNVLNIVYDIISEYIPSSSGNRNDFLISARILNGNGKDLNLNKNISYEEAILFFNRAVDYFYSLNNLGGKGFMYKTEKNGNTAYLYGSVHIGDPEMYPINKKVMDTFNSSDELYVEVNIMKKDNSEYIDSKTYRNDGKTLKDDLGEENYAKFKKILDKYEIKEDKFLNLKPWAAYNLLTNLPMYIYMPDAPFLGIDRYFITKAYFKKMPVKELESAELQTDVLSSFTDEEYIELFNEYVDLANTYGLEALNSGSANLMYLWNNGDASGLNGTITKEDKYSKNLFDKRDIGMADTVEKLLNSKEKKTYFIVAGSAHFTPDDSVVKILQDRGYKVERISI